MNIEERRSKHRQYSDWTDRDDQFWVQQARIESRRLAVLDRLLDKAWTKNHEEADALIGAKSLMTQDLAKCRGYVAKETESWFDGSAFK